MQLIGVRRRGRLATRGMYNVWMNGFSNATLSVTSTEIREYRQRYSGLTYSLR